MMKHVITIGTRGSRLALTQTNHIADLLRAAAPEAEVRIEVISTKGDRIVDRPLIAVGGKGLFTRELEVALLEGRIDLAVHSMKDLPTDLPAGLALGAVPPREDPRDALLTSSGALLETLHNGAVVGTSSLRRQAQLRAYRPDLKFVDLRGNVDTRVRKVKEGPLDAAVLACAGLNRLGYAAAITEEIPPEIMLPAPAQGALAIEIREDDDAIRALLVRIGDENTAVEVAAERTVLAALGGGCSVPIGALGRVSGDTLTLSACVCSPDGTKMLRASASGSVTDAKNLGEQTARELMDKGAEAIIASVETLVVASRPQPLAGKKVVVTRARTQAAGLVESLKHAGADVIEFPAIEIQPVEEPIDLGCAMPYDWVVLTSSNAARMFLAQIENQGCTPKTLNAKIAAIGPGTAAIVQEHGFTVDLMPEKHVAESLFALLLTDDHHLEGERILLPRSDIARSFLPDALRNEGAEVKEWIAYRTFSPEISEAAIQSLCEAAPDIVTFTSPSTVQNFCELLGAKRLATIQEGCVFASIGPITTQKATELGLTMAIESSKHDMHGLVEAIVAAV